MMECSNLPPISFGCPDSKRDYTLLLTEIAELGVTLKKGELTAIKNSTSLSYSYEPEKRQVKIMTRFSTITKKTNEQG